MTHIVTAPAVQITAAARTHFLERGAVLPAGVPEDVLERLTAEGMIAEVIPEVEVVIVEQPPTDPYKGISAGDAKAELEKRNADRSEGDKIVPATPGNRAEIVAALTADDEKHQD